MTIPEHIFRGYDIRGPVKDFEPEIIERVGKAYVALTGARKVALGWDMRESSPEIVDALIRGLTSMGTDVVKLGMVSSPMVYNAVGMNADIEGGMMVTASHCASHMNGIKMCRADVSPIGFGSGMEELRELVRENAFEESSTSGTVSERDVSDEVIDAFFAYAGDIDVSDMKVVLDAGNSVGALYLPRVFDRLGCEHIDLYFELDDSFPNHEANPNKPATLKVLQERVVQEGAHAGFAFDGDGDRVGMVDEMGRIVRPDYLATLLATKVLEKFPGGLCMGNITNTRDMERIVVERGGRYGKTPVGHANIKRMMREQGAVFAGELSGHMYFSEFYNAESVLLPAILILKMMKDTGKKLSELYDSVQHYHHSGEINFHVEDKAAMMKEAKEHYMQLPDAVLTDFDGVRIDFPTWWLSLRPSANDPVLRLNVEGSSSEELQTRLDELMTMITTSSNGGTLDDSH